MIHYREGTAGYIMDTQVFTLPGDITVKEALTQLRKHSGHVLEYVYVLDRKNILIGYFTLHQLITAQNQCFVSSITRKILWKLHPNMRTKAIFTIPAWQTFTTLPVVDEKGVFLGAIQYNSLLRLEHEAVMPSFSKEVVNVGNALGELYWIGISAFTSGFVAAAMPKRPNSGILKREN